MKRPIARLPRLATAIVIAGLVAALRAEEPAEAPAKVNPPTERPAAESAQPESTAAESTAPEPKGPESTAPDSTAPDAPPETKPRGPDWPVGLERARKRAQADGKPLLVRAGAPWCPWCDKLLEQFDTPEVQEQLKRWTIVYVDIDDTPGEARQLSVGAIPALRVVNATGKVVATQEGYLEQDELLAWLKESFDRAALERPEVLLSDKELEPSDVDKLIKLLQTSDPVAREAALRRLMPNAKLAAAPVVEAFIDGKLATRLPTLELLAHWQAPVEAIDPWRPETVTPERIKALQAWTEQEAVKLTPPATKLSDEDVRYANDAIARLLEDDDAQAAARVEQLAHFGEALRPLVLEKLKTAADDRARERLLLLRYRLAAGDALVLTWTGGLARLASSDVNVRHEATAQLVERATAADQSLLLELFADADPLVREISLRGLRSVGTDASSSALVKLLDDPEPNVRAAVLKQLAESPDAALNAKISAYLKTETDPDLVVHGVRVLKAAKAPTNLIELLHHPSWQVRAEAAEALGTLALPQNANPRTADIYAALIGVLSDEDAFVISRAVRALRSANLPSAVEPLAKAAVDHPEIATEVIATLTQGSLRNQAEPVLRRYIEHKDPQLRAQVITALANPGAADVGDLIERGLKDPATEVRTATAKRLLQICNQLGLQQTAAVSVGNVNQVQEGGGVSRVVSTILFDSFKAAPPVAPAKKPAEPAKDDAAKDADEPAKDDSPKETDGPAKDDSSKEGDDVAKDAAEPADDPRLVAFREGNKRPKWISGAIVPLETMLQAETSEEKQAAALALLPLGHDQPALEVLRGLVASEPVLLDDVGHALPWLLWSERLKFFDELLVHQPDKTQLYSIALQMLAREPERGVSRLWKLLEADDQQAETTLAVGRAIMQAYAAADNPVRVGHLSLGKEQMAELTRYATEGTAWQKEIALARLIEASPDKAAELAQRVHDEPSAPDAFRHDALQMMLLAANDKDATKIAAGEIAATDPATRRLALLYLSGGQQAIHLLRGELQVNPGGGVRAYSRESPGLDPPVGVTIEMLTPVLADPDDETAAAAGCVAALLGSAEGLPTLVRVWRAHKESDNWTHSLYRAIAALDDDQNTPLLVEINKQLSTWDKRQFYWTIRSMHGPAILKLRKQIRDEVGMENLR
jgi:HEAT repeat protein